MKVTAGRLLVVIYERFWVMVRVSKVRGMVTFSVRVTVSSVLVGFPGHPANSHLCCIEGWCYI